MAAVTAPAAALATALPVTGPFGLTPAPTAAGQPRSYFQLTVAPGHSALETAIISNEGTRTERLRVTTSRGVTATNSGSAFDGTTTGCTGAGCWIRDIPHTVTLAPGVRKALGFKVTVPRWTRPGQYLAGLTAESAIRPRAVKVGSNGRASARAIIIDQVTVGVAVTVGRISRLKTALVILPVSAGWVGSTPRLYIPVANRGRTFVKATGNITCRSGGRLHVYRVIMETVLPGGRAVLPINAKGLSSGPVPCAVWLRDAAGSTFTWSGRVNVPPHTLTRTYHPNKSVYVSLPETTVPPWAVALIVIGALILASLLALVIQNRRHLRRPADRPGQARPAGRSRKARPAGLPRKRTAT
jgi:hypothetical protein